VKCVICKQGETVPGVTSMLFEENGSTIVVKGIPADVCDTCGESYLDADVTRRLLQLQSRGFLR
jgi:YgiT-type zinc finger domain-containing protein